MGTQRAIRNHMYTSYWGDGNGRDWYVVSGNGGNRNDGHPVNWVSSQEQQMFNSKTGVGWKAFSKIQGKAPLNPLKSSYGGQRPNILNYHGDGSGRDTYVIYQYQGGNGKEYRRGFVDYQKEWLRNDKVYPYETP